MQPPLISARGLGKRYRLGATLSPNTLRDHLVEGGKALLRRRGSSTRPAAESEIWAVRDVTFDVAQGEVFGIIGRNGAGKSTLLKILSRITEPTQGEAILRGRVASLLEIGTGFHTELTGRENIFLNGAILGMRKAEIRRKFDEIVAFAGVEPFIDTPIKRYSSGMTVRLAFSVAAHLDPEILVIDEVLAVGDVEFQRRCIGAMGDVARSGRTVLFVSHNMAAVSNLCQRAMVLERGTRVFEGPVDQAVEHYLSMFERNEHPVTRGRYVKKAALFVGGREAGNHASVPMGQSCALRLAVSGAPADGRPSIGVVLRRRAMGDAVFGINSDMTGDLLDQPPLDAFEATVHLMDLRLVPGEYDLDLYVGNGVQNYEVLHGAASLTVVESDVYGTGKAPSPHFGPVYAHARFEMGPANRQAND